MPRRISDYPDAFAGWNQISSSGSLISVVATWLFLFVLYVQLVQGEASHRYPWLRWQFYGDLFQTLFNRNYNSLEWGLNSPPKPHAFVSLPLQSGFQLQQSYFNLKKKSSPTCSFFSPRNLNTISNKHRPKLARINVNNRRGMVSNTAPLGFLFGAPTFFLILIGFYAGLSFNPPGSEGVGLSITPVEHFFQAMVNNLNEVNTIRRASAHNFRQTMESLTRLNELATHNRENVLNIFRGGNNNIIDLYNLMLQHITTSITEFSNWSRLAEDNDILLSVDFELHINSLDLLASTLEEIIRTIDPNFDFGPDTDDEMCRQAAIDLANRRSN